MGSFDQLRQTVFRGGCLIPVKIRGGSTWQVGLDECGWHRQFLRTFLDTYLCVACRYYVYLCRYAELFLLANCSSCGWYFRLVAKTVPVTLLSKNFDFLCLISLFIYGYRCRCHRHFLIYVNIFFQKRKQFFRSFTGFILLYFLLWENVALVFFLRSG